MGFHTNFFPTDPSDAAVNNLMQYLQKQTPETLNHIAQSATPEVKQIISHNVQGLVGMLPGEDFQMAITTDRDNLANLLASAMMTGYFLSKVEQRMHLDVNLGEHFPQ